MIIKLLGVLWKSQREKKCIFLKFWRQSLNRRRRRQNRRQGQTDKKLRHRHDYGLTGRGTDRQTSTRIQSATGTAFLDVQLLTFHCFGWPAMAAKRSFARNLFNSTFSSGSYPVAQWYPLYKPWGPVHGSQWRTTGKRTLIGSRDETLPVVQVQHPLFVAVSAGGFSSNEIWVHKGFG